MGKFRLYPFPGQDTGGLSIEGDVAGKGRSLVFSFVLRGDLVDIVLPPATETGRCDGLWQSTCFELFWTEEGREGYWEMNLATNGAWNVYAFRAYRAGMCREERVAQPLSETRQATDSFLLAAELDLGGLPFCVPDLRLGVSAVIARRDGGLSYWALAHPGVRPDFHDPRGFLLQTNLDKT